MVGDKGGYRATELCTTSGGPLLRQAAPMVPKRSTPFKVRSRKLRTDLELSDTWLPPLDPSHAYPRHGLGSAVAQAKNLVQAKMAQDLHTEV